MHLIHLLLFPVGGSLSDQTGHHVPGPVSYQMDKGDHNNLVFQSFQNWQTAEHGGEGRIRIAVHRMKEQKVDHYVFNPMLADKFKIIERISYVGHDI